MRVLVIGSGGREHAMAWRLAQDADVTEILAVPGNPGIAQVARLVPGSVTDPDGLLEIAAREHIDLTVVGPEAALDRGVADTFRAAGRAIVGPPRRAAALETSKVFAKEFMTRVGIPTARFVVCRTPAEALDAVAGRLFGFPVVVKADGLAGGKCVVIARDRTEAEAAVRASMIDRQFGDAGVQVVIEECLVGPEVSFFVLADGTRAIPFGTAQDHKRAFDDDQGPNTGGMGAFAPSPLVTSALAADVMRTIVEPVIGGLRDDGGYRGFLYVSLMLTAYGPKVIEFNVRFGDPETQVVWPLLEGPMAATLDRAARGTLTTATVMPGRGAYVGVVLASEGYPGAVKSGVPIRGLDATRPNLTYVFHAGTKQDGDAIVTAGGRVLTVVAHGDTHRAARECAYAAASAISFDGMHYRRDIGASAVTPQ